MVRQVICFYSNIEKGFEIFGFYIITKKGIKHWQEMNKIAFIFYFHICSLLCPLQRSQYPNSISHVRMIHSREALSYIIFIKRSLHLNITIRLLIYTLEKGSGVFYFFDDLILASKRIFHNSCNLPLQFCHPAPLNYICFKKQNSERINFSRH